MSIGTAPADQGVAKRLTVRRGTTVTKVSFIVDVDEVPMAYFDFFARKDVAPAEMVRAELDESIIDLFDGCGGRPRLDSYRMEVREVRAEPTVAKLLSVSNGRTLFLFDGDLLDEQNKVIGISKGYFVPECVRITVDRMAVVHEHTKQCI